MRFSEYLEELGLVRARDVVSPTTARFARRMTEEEKRQPRWDAYIQSRGELRASFPPKEGTRRRWRQRIVIGPLKGRTPHLIHTDELDRLVMEGPVYVFCTCPAFYWQGHAYGASSKKAGLTEVAIPAEIWGPRHEGKLGMCKHLATIASLLRTSGGPAKILRAAEDKT